MITTSNSSAKRSGLPNQFLDVLLHYIACSELARVRTAIQGTDANSLTVKYFAPSTSGTFHVVVQSNASSTLVKDGTAVITVSP